MISYLRFKSTIGSVKGTFGAWLDGQIAFATGLEPRKPIIPAGTYSVSWYLSPKRGKYVFLIKNVPGHAGVEVHTGNQAQDTEGCMLIGLGYGLSDVHGLQDVGVVDSKKGFTLLKEKVGTVKPWALMIREA